jgi:hypothetical protein
MVKDRLGEEISAASNARLSMGRFMMGLPMDE